ncbi:hypothetical protein K239x_44160 [Planctomycetes bacterium K23_9]|uniref:Uncharacterized protein n=1 Tax=Stieleria marina TaxID=1930275 RepID=A0A517NZ60_9BACT|nr:hypothetical protein K239x_44160 [Planctomycetes bacterium K23_9]
MADIHSQFSTHDFELPLTPPPDRPATVLVDGLPDDCDRIADLRPSVWCGADIDSRHCVHNWRDHMRTANSPQLHRAGDRYRWLLLFPPPPGLGSICNDRWLGSAAERSNPPLPGDVPVDGQPRVSPLVPMNTGPTRSPRALTARLRIGNHHPAKA